MSASVPALAWNAAHSAGGSIVAACSRAAREAHARRATVAASFTRATTARTVARSAANVLDCGLARRVVIIGRAACHEGARRQGREMLQHDVEHTLALLLRRGRVHMEMGEQQTENEAHVWRRQEDDSLITRLRAGG